MIDGADITAWPQEIIPVFCEIARSGKRKASRRRPKGEMQSFASGVVVDQTARR